MITSFSYAIPSAFDSARDRASLSLAPDARRPLRFVGRVTDHVLQVRFALQGLGRVIWSDDTWHDDLTFGWRTLDPVVTVHPDRLMLEAFSQDLSTWGCVLLPRERFETEGEVVCGTTNVDFTAWLAAALDEMRSSRQTWLRVEPGGVEVRTDGYGGRHEPKVDVPDPWLRAYLSLQAAMAMPGTRLEVRPVDLLHAVRYLSVTKARVSPRGLRFELRPDEDAALILEPWEHEIALKGAWHGGTEARTVRVWGRRRLRLLEPLLPHATAARVYLKGRALPWAVAVDLPGGITFLLVLSGFTARAFAGSGYRLLAPDDAPEDVVRRAHAVLRERVAIGTPALAEALGVDLPTAARATARLCRRGLGIWDLERRELRHRELLADPVDEEALFPPDERELEGRRLLPAVRLTSSGFRETRKLRRLKTPDGPIERELVFRDLVVGAEVDGQTTEIVLSDEDRLIFGRCTCTFFAEHLLNQGPCAHLVATRLAADALRARSSDGEGSGDGTL
ncbi:MAG: hypothetical protein KC621_21840 [Myxococcales bacterium]|nr:hypothetical protein [Myxococcales bacterium]